MLSRRFATALARGRRALPALALATALYARRALSVFLLVALLFWTFGWPVRPVRAEHESGREPVRLEVVLKVVRILDDQDWFGSGEMALNLGLRTCDVRAAVHPCWDSADFPPRFLGGWAQTFSADSGDILTIDRAFPRPGDRLDGALQAEAVGFPAYPGHAYRLVFGMMELDPTSVELAQCFTFVWCDPSPALGTVSLDLDEANGWGIGVHGRVRSFNHDEGQPGDFEITYEVRRAPLPDLHPTSIEVLPIPGGGESVCLGVENVGQQDAGPFEMVFRIDGQDVPNGTVAAGRLAAGESGKLCLPAELPRGVHTLSASADEPRGVLEMDERNNSFERQFVRLAGGGAVGGLPDGPSVVELPEEPADLVVTSLKVARQADGSGICQGDELNHLLAQVKNAGPGPAGDFALHLAVGGDLKQERVYVQALAAGATVDVTIPTDDLNDGTQTVAVIADGDSQVPEQDENNNAHEITADCD
jgi:hypothetical protein